MNNLLAVKQLCNAICSSFYPDSATIALALFNEGIQEDVEATPKDANIFKVAVALVKGYVESSRSEGGTSVSVDSEKVDNSIKFWCGIYGLNAEDILTDSSVRTIEDGTHLW